ncbi:hypothetical protein B0H10DRAFT_1235521 [Mycena sp. CBHHK59/15]|nr:hypothetical protein B0H10DRAFT_1235521 [Mycena sp. CBHHK59/15]
MSTSKRLNVLVLEPFELVCVVVDPASSPDETKEALARHLSSPASSIFVLQAPPNINLPISLTPESIRNALPAVANLEELPRAWDMHSLFNAQHDLHLVAAPRQPFNINIYDTQTKKLRRTATAALTSRLESLFPALATKVYKPPSHLTCGTSAERKTAEAYLLASSIELASSTELSTSCRLLDIYPWGLTPGEVHFIVDSLVYQTGPK